MPEWDGWVDGWMLERMDGCLGECCIDYIRITTFFKVHSCFPFFLLHRETGLCTCSSNSAATLALRKLAVLWVTCVNKVIPGLNKQLSLQQALHCRGLQADGSLQRETLTLSVNFRTRQNWEGQD